jgi:glucosamine--fructose-6-phosphate aminotransferase (isomerizing)
MTNALGTHFEAEIREQPAVWRRLADSDKAATLAAALRGSDILFLGSGSSLFVAQLAALASSEARFDPLCAEGVCVVALSQSGRSADVLDALDILAPKRFVAVTNDPASPLAERADVAIAIDAGREQAIPATKSVTTMHALLLWAAALQGGSPTRDASQLRAAADDVEAFLADVAADAVFAEAAAAIARLRSVVFVGAGYGVAVASELALKLKEATYLHGEGFAAGEFRHGSTALLDDETALVGIVDDESRELVARALGHAPPSGLRYTIGGAISGTARLGRAPGTAFTSLMHLAAGQYAALAIGRARGIDGDAPRGLTKVVR